MRTQVGIIGAGPAGLMLARLLRMQGLDSVVIENRSEEYIYNRIRAGLIEHWAADLLTDVGVGERMKREGVLHWGNYIGINGGLHHIDFKKLVGKRVTIYGQQEVVKDLQDYLDKSRGTTAPWAKARIFGTRIRRNIKLAECPSFGKSIFHYAPKCPGAEDYKALAREILGETLAVLSARVGIDDRGQAKLLPLDRAADTKTAKMTSE